MQKSFFFSILTVSLVFKCEPMVKIKVARYKATCGSCFARYKLTFGSDVCEGVMGAQGKVVARDKDAREKITKRTCRFLRFF